jgi:large subunit ribosomal protein L25
VKHYNKGHFLTTLFNIDVGGRKTRVLPRDVQVDPVMDYVTHVDFMRIAEGAEIRVAIPVVFHNHDKSPGLKRGGVLNIVRHEVELYVNADAIPDHIDVNLEGLEIGASVHISHIKLPEGTRPVIRDRDFTVATIAGAVEEKAEVAAGAEGEAVAAEAAAAAAPAAEAKGKDEKKEEKKK